MNKLSRGDQGPRSSARATPRAWCKISRSPRRRSGCASRLRASGVRPINNIVDITNYVMLEYGQPMHAFDYRLPARRQDHRPPRRRGRDPSGRSTATSARSHARHARHCRRRRVPSALAGVMGGANSEITDETTTVVFESANFLGHSIRKTATGPRHAHGRLRPGLKRASTRSLTVPAVDRACELVEMLGAGEVVRRYDRRARQRAGDDVHRAGRQAHQRPARHRYPARVHAPIRSPRSALSSTAIRSSSPPGAATATMLADIAEEVARFCGYNNIPKPPTSAAQPRSGGSQRTSTLFVRQLGDGLPRHAAIPRS